MTCRVRDIALPIVVALPAVTAAAVSAAAAMAGNVARWVESVGRELADGLAELDYAVPLATPGTTLHRLHCCLPAHRLLKDGGLALKLEIGGTAHISDASGKFYAFAVLLQDGQPVAAFRPMDDGVELVAPDNCLTLVRHIVSTAVATAFVDAEAKQGYVVMDRSGTPSGLRLAARRSDAEDLRVSLKASWKNTGLRAMLSTEGHEPGGHAHHPDVGPFLAQIGLQHLDPDQSRPHKPLRPSPGGQSIRRVDRPGISELRRLR